MCWPLNLSSLDAMTAEFFPDGLPPIPDFENLKLGPWIAREDQQAVRVTIHGRHMHTGLWVWSRATLHKDEVRYYQREHGEDLQRVLPVILRGKILGEWEDRHDFVADEIARRQGDVDAAHESGETQQGRDGA